MATSRRGRNPTPTTSVRGTMLGAPYGRASRVLAAAFALLATLVALTPELASADGVVLVSVVNDTTRRVVVEQCDVTCAETHDNAYLAPGQTWKVNASDENIDEYIEVVDATQPRTACLDLKYPNPRPTATVYVSRAVGGSCPMGSVVTTPATAVALAVWIGGSFVILVFCMVGGVRVFYRLRARGWRDLTGILVATLAVLGLFMGGWLGYLPYLAVRWVQKKRRGTSPAPPLAPSV
jgi:hypothetical protein